jgi:GNAT superfamily N-acetyltransferase
MVDLRFIRYRRATLADVPHLAELNRQLIQDEGHRNPMTPAELARRMHRWLEGEYEALLFKADEVVVAYALYRPEGDYIYLRQFFVHRHYRRQGIGRRAIELLRSEIWPANRPIRVEVLAHNKPAGKFWRAVGFAEYAITLEME